MQKLNLGFSKYFNLKYEREGTLFASRYKSVPIKTELQSDLVSRYISIINPLDVYQSGWREQGLKNWQEAFNFLENYAFSSFPDRIGKRRSKILAPDEILERYFLKIGTEPRDKYIEEFVKDFLKERATPPSFFLE